MVYFCPVFVVKSLHRQCLVLLLLPRGAVFPSLDFSRGLKKCLTQTSRVQTFQDDTICHNYTSKVETAVNHLSTCVCGPPIPTSLSGLLFRPNDVALENVSHLFLELAKENQNRFLDEEVKLIKKMVNRLTHLCRLASPHAGGDYDLGSRHRLLLHTTTLPSGAKPVMEQVLRTVKT
ncbi:hypothetical protein GH733_002491 [Mirounga leonina]|nr:hypothetical protein GH733_002491 [Mirounga leonina]